METKPQRWRPLGALVVDEDGLTVATIHEDRSQPDTGARLAIERARLLAAAPRMRDVLKRVVEGDGESWHLLEDAKAVLATISAGMTFGDDGYRAPAPLEVEPDDQEAPVPPGVARGFFK